MTMRTRSNSSYSYPSSTRPRSLVQAVLSLNHLRMPQGEQSDLPCDLCTGLQALYNPQRDCMTQRFQVLVTLELYAYFAYHKSMIFTPVSFVLLTLRYRFVEMLQVCWAARRQIRKGGY